MSAMSSTTASSSTPSTISGSSEPPSQAPPLSWEGDRMFNIYIYDYCSKRGFKKTARELLQEADIPTDSAPPINARQGLLFEWWSVFWVLFTAKSSGAGTEDAMIYINHQTQQQSHRQSAARMQQPMTRYANGMAVQPRVLPNGPMPNGVGPAPMPGGHTAMPGPTGSIPFPMASSGPQPNGMPGASAPQIGLGPSPNQPANYSQMMPGQRPGGPQPQRAPNGIPPFQSPVMANSPQNPGVGGGVPGQLHSQALIGGQIGPSPHMAHIRSGAMLPPNGPQGMGNQGPMGHMPHAQTPGSFRPSSRTGSPSQNPGMTQPSPSLMARQPPMTVDGLNAMNDWSRLPIQMLNQLKQDAGLGNKDPATFTPEERQRLSNLARQRTGKSGQPAGNPNAAPGPSGSNQQSMQPPNPRNSIGQLNPNPQGQGQRPAKRNSTSPGEQHDNLPRSDTSPPDRKRPRRSPSEHQLQQQSQPGQMANGMGRMSMGAPPMNVNGFPSQGMMQYMPGNPQMGQMGQGMGGPPGGHTMSPGMSHPATAGMNPQLQYTAANNRYHLNMQQGMQNMGKPPGNTGSPAPSDPSFNPGGQQQPQGQFPGSRAMAPNNKPIGGMMPPPSPGMNGPPKDQSSANKDKPSSSSGIPDGSPRNASQNAQGALNPNSLLAAPPTPTPGGGGVMTAPSPSTGSVGVDASVFTNDFLQLVASGLEEFDPSMFAGAGGGDRGDMDFQRDFGQWVNPDDIGALDLK